MGMAIDRARTLRGLGALTLAIGAFGWGCGLTDGVGNVVLEAALRLVHFGFGLLFSLGWVVPGLGLWWEGRELRLL